MNGALRLSLISVCTALSTGCASTFSGLGGSSSYACKAPTGVLCTSVAGVYANSLQNNLPSQRADKPDVDAAGKHVAAPRAATLSNTMPSTIVGTEIASIRSAPRVLRVWVAPWEDSDQDLQDQSYIYVVVDTGRWLIDHQRASLRNEFAPIAAPSPPAASEAAEPTPPATANLPRPGSPFSPAGTTPLAPRVNNDVEPTVR